MVIGDITIKIIEVEGAGSSGLSTICAEDSRTNQMMTIAKFCNQIEVKDKLMKQLSLVG